jgi:hypothetical protein
MFNLKIKIMGKDATIKAKQFVKGPNYFPEWDPGPDWPHPISPDQWIRFHELAIDLAKKQLEIKKQYITGIKDIIKNPKG